MDFVEIFIMGKKYSIPSELTVQKAMEYAGFQIIRGCGCRGGVCGACVIVYRTPKSTKIQTGLACLTQVQEGMMFEYLNSDNFILTTYEKTINSNSYILKPGTEASLYSDSYIKKINNEKILKQHIMIEKAAKLSQECVMCGLCAARCPAELPPHYIGLLCRRLYGKYLVPVYPHVSKRLRQLDSGEFDEEMDKIVRLSIEELREEYRKAQADKQVI